ncbi:MAG TPA: hypothetical protein PKC63_08585 [Mariniflexile sp.]|nr:hypothetical protein [Mariniflexile sp.]
MMVDCSPTSSNLKKYRPEAKASKEIWNAFDAYLASFTTLPNGFISCQRPFVMELDAIFKHLLRGLDR